MTEEDRQYILQLLRAEILQSSVLELGAGYGGSTCQEMIKSAGLDYVTTDVVAGEGVDFLADFESDACAQAFSGQQFGSVLVLNVLEHVFMPIRVLDNAVELTRPGGTVVVIVPSAWPVHNYPLDCQRLLPDWFIEFARRRPQLSLLVEHFVYVGFGPVRAHARGKEIHLPPPGRTDLHRWYSRAVHRAFNTAGRSQWCTSHVAIGAVFQKNSN